MDPIQAAEILALAAWEVVDRHHNDPASITDETRAALRKGAFLFSKNVKSSDDWRVTYGRPLAAAAIVWANDDRPETFRALERASRQFEEKRIAG
jgi:hypothetical protein